MFYRCDSCSACTSYPTDNRVSTYYRSLRLSFLFHITNIVITSSFDHAPCTFSLRFHVSYGVRTLSFTTFIAQVLQVRSIMLHARSRCVSMYRMVPLYIFSYTITCREYVSTTNTFGSVVFPFISYVQWQYWTCKYGHHVSTNNMLCYRRISRKYIVSYCVLCSSFCWKVWLENHTVVSITSGSESKNTLLLYIITTGQSVLSLYCILLF